MVFVVIHSYAYGSVHMLITDNERKLLDLGFACFIASVVIPWLEMFFFETLGRSGFM